MPHLIEIATLNKGGISLRNKQLGHGTGEQNKMTLKEYKEFQEFLTKKMKNPPNLWGKAMGYKQLEGWEAAFLSMKSALHSMKPKEEI